MEQNAVTKWEWVPYHPALVPKKLRVVPPPPSPRPKRLLFSLLIVLLALGSSAIYLLWSSMQQESEARKQALLRQQAWELEWRAESQRQARTMESLKQQIEIASAQPILPPEAVQPQEPAALKPNPSRANPSLPAELPKPSELTPELQAKERVKMELSPDGDSLPQDGEPKRKRGLTRFLKSSLFVDSAVLTTSLLVPPSIPLTLAQSRLGRRLTGRVLKKTKTDKTVAAKVVRDVGDMPITQRRRR